MRSSDGRKDAPHRLSGWQAIADYFQRNPSTVRRWAAEHGLPVHRPAGSVARKGAAVFAYPEELDGWLRRFKMSAERLGISTDPGPVPEAMPALQAGSAGRRRWRSIGAGGAVLGLAAVALIFWSQAGALLGLTPDRPAPQAYLSTEANRQLYSNASYLIDKRTRDSLPQAIDILERITRDDPQYDRAWSALATAYNLMVEYRLVEVGEGYALSKAAAETALALNPSLATAQAVLADLEFFWLRSAATAMAGFERAVALDPSDAQTRHWYAMALTFSGEPSRAMAEIRQARYIDPRSRSIRVSEAMVLLGAGQIDAAGMVLEDLIRHEPEYSNPYRFLSFVKLGRSDYDGYLDAWARRFELTGDQAGGQIVDAGRAGLADSGREGMVAAMIAAIDGDGGPVDIEPYFLAHLHALSGDIRHTADCLEQVPTRHAFYYTIDPAFSEIRKQAGFQDALRSMNMPVI